MRIQRGKEKLEKKRKLGRGEKERTWIGERKERKKMEGRKMKRGHIKIKQIKKQKKGNITRKRMSGL